MDCRAWAGLRTGASASRVGKGGDAPGKVALLPGKLVFLTGGHRYEERESEEPQISAND